MTELETIQHKHARLDYLLKFLQIFLATKKEYALMQQIEEEIKKLATAELPPVEAPKIEVRQG